MKARFINEIVRNKQSAVASLGIGKEAMNRGYREMMNMFPKIDDYAYPLVAFDNIKANESHFGSTEYKDSLDIELSRDEMEDISMISRVPLKELVYINPDLYATKFKEVENTMEILSPLNLILNKNHVVVELETKDPWRQLKHNNKIVKFKFVWWEDFQLGYLMLADGTWVFLVFKDPEL